MNPDDTLGLDPTEEQIEADHLLALRTSWATLTGGAALVSPVGGAALVALTPIADRRSDRDVRGADARAAPS